MWPEAINAYHQLLRMCWKAITYLARAVRTVYRWSMRCLTWNRFGGPEEWGTWRLVHVFLAQRSPLFRSVWVSVAELSLLLESVRTTCLLRQRRTTQSMLVNLFFFFRCSTDRWIYRFTFRNFVSSIFYALLQPFSTTDFIFNVTVEKLGKFSFRDEIFTLFFWNIILDKNESRPWCIPICAEYRNKCIRRFWNN